ncbi:MAG: hypothetical protein ACREDR_24630, partial [Blastocatellia bacterium]
MSQTGFRLLVLVAIAGFAMAMCPGLVPAAQKPSGSPGQTGKIAFINSDSLQDQLFEYKAKIDALNRQFEPRVK